MRRCIAALAALGLLAVWAAPGLLAAEAKVEPAKTKKKADAGKKPKGDAPFGEKEEGEAKDKDKAKVAEGETSPFGEDIDAIDAKVTLTEVQKKKLEGLKEARGKALEAWDKTNGKRMEQAQEKLSKIESKGDKDKRADGMRKQIETYLETMKAKRAAVGSGFQKRMFLVLKPEQRAKWNAPILTEAVTKDFSALFLEPKQEEKIASLCQAQAGRLSAPFDPEDEAHAKALAPLKSQIYRTVLTKKQQADYRSTHKTEGDGNKNKKRRG